MSGVVTGNLVRNVGTSSVQVLAANLQRKILSIVNKHATQTARIKFGSGIVATDVTAVQTIMFGNVPDDGQFILNWNGVDSAAILFSDAAADLQTALRAISGLASVTVAGDFTVGFTVTMTGASPNVDPNLPDLILTSSTLNLDSVLTGVTIATTVVGKYADGYLIAAAGGQLNFNAGYVPVDSIFSLASGANTRIEILEG